MVLVAHLSPSGERCGERQRHRHAGHRSQKFHIVNQCAGLPFDELIPFYPQGLNRDWPAFCWNCGCKPERSGQTYNEIMFWELQPFESICNIQLTRTAKANYVESWQSYFRWHTLFKHPRRINCSRRIRFQGLTFRIGSCPRQSGSMRSRSGRHRGSNEERP